LFQAFRLDFPQLFPVLIDHQSAIALAGGPAAHHQRTKHIATKFYFQRKLLLDGVVRFQHQSTDYLVADMLTEDLQKLLHRRHRDVLFGRKQMKNYFKEIARKLQNVFDSSQTRKN
jgi:hypothetical protein